MNSSPSGAEKLPITELIENYRMQLRYRKHDYFLLAVGLVFVINAIAVTFTSALNLGILLEGAIGGLLIFLIILSKGAFVAKHTSLWHIIKVGFLIGLLLISSLLVPIFYHGTHSDYQAADYVIILGAGLRGDAITWALKERLDKAIAYLADYSQAKVVVSGGQGPRELLSEAEAMQRYLILNGIEADRILIEDQSTSTYENFVFSQRLLTSHDIKNPETVIIITNDFHMFRSKILAKRNGFYPLGLPCKTPWPIFISSYLRETFALVKSVLFDR